MTNEPIMIDDVNVSVCSYFKMNNKMPLCRACNSGVGSPYCEYNKDCYYKQLKRKEQECDQLKAELKEFKDMAKEGLDNYKDVGGCWGCGISFSFDELLKSYKKLEESYFEATKESPTATRINAKFNKYEKALQEIKDVAENILIECNNCDQYSCSGCPDENKEELAQQILQKCEVIND